MQPQDRSPTMWIISSVIILIISLATASLYSVSPEVFPELTLRYTGNVYHYLRAMNVMAHNNVTIFFDADTKMRQDWLIVTTRRFGPIEDELYYFALKGDSSEKRMAVYLLKFQNTDKAARILRGLSKVDDPDVREALDWRPQ